jgi:PAS domain S-box-containing protein
MKFPSNFHNIMVQNMEIFVTGFNLLVDHFDRPLICLNPNYDIFAINFAASQLFCLEKEKLLGANVLQICRERGISFPLPAAVFKGPVQETLHDIRCDVASVDKIWRISWDISKLTDKNNQMHGIIMTGILICSDCRKISHCNGEITDKDEEISILRNIIAKLPGHVYWKDKNGVYLGSNDENTKSAGLFTAREIIGKTDFEMPWRKDAELYREMDLQVMQTGNTIKQEEKGKLANGSWKTVLSQKTPLRGVNGDIIGVLGNGVDITELKQAQAALEQAKEKAEAANLAKDQFIANMEHDLKTPCIGITQMLNILVNREKDLTTRKILRKVLHASKQLLGLLNDILHFSCIQHGSIPITCIEFDIREIVTSIINIEEPFVHAKNLQLVYEIAADVPHQLIGDKHRVHRILLNLIGNAIKFTKEGKVKILITLAEKIGVSNIKLKLVIEDTGIGIPKDKQKQIYDRFVRVNVSNQGKYQGFGLGLNIVKQFVNELQGTINTQSEVNSGTKITCILPFALPSSPQVADEIAEIPTIIAAAESMQKYNIGILLVEDSELIQMATMELLQNNITGRVDLAANGADAISLVKKNDYDLVLMDIGLPDISGYEAAQRIKQLGGGKGSIPIIALTAHDKHLVQNPKFQNSVDDFVAKPLNLKKLHGLLNKWLELPH